MNTVEKSRENLTEVVDSPKVQTQKQREEAFFAVTIDDDKVLQYRRISRSKLIGNMGEFAEQLFKKEIRTLHIVTN